MRKKQRKKGRGQETYQESPKKKYVRAPPVSHGPHDNTQIVGHELF